MPEFQLPEEIDFGYAKKMYTQMENKLSNITKPAEVSKALWDVLALITSKNGDFKPDNTTLSDDDKAKLHINLQLLLNFAGHANEQKSTKAFSVRQKDLTPSSENKLQDTHGKKELLYEFNKNLALANDQNYLAKRLYYQYAAAMCSAILLRHKAGDLSAELHEKLTEIADLLNSIKHTVDAMEQVEPSANESILNFGNANLAVKVSRLKKLLAQQVIKDAISKVEKHELLACFSKAKTIYSKIMQLYNETLAALPAAQANILPKTLIDVSGLIMHGSDWKEVMTHEQLIVLAGLMDLEVMQHAIKVIEGIEYLRYAQNIYCKIDQAQLELELNLKWREYLINSATGDWKINISEVELKQLKKLMDSPALKEEITRL